MKSQNFTNTLELLFVIVLSLSWRSRAVLAKGLTGAVSLFSVHLHRLLFVLDWLKRRLARRRSREIKEAAKGGKKMRTITRTRISCPALALVLLLSQSCVGSVKIASCACCCSC